MVLYLKYRPQTLDEVLGQDHIVTTLKNALEAGRAAHAYLFAGPRGTGKTSVARILAKELGVKDFDLIEIDAASHRGIDDVRSLREAVNFLPTQSPKKLYILDEAHMLTKEAFNALLKTLEEPPAHAHFVLCTTEPHKVPLTIISRCLRFDFNPAEDAVLQDFVEGIAKKEKVRLEKEVYQLIVKLAQGSFRDALGFLETLTHQVEDKKTLKLTHAQKILGLVETKEAQELNSAILQKEIGAALQKIQTLSTRGVNFHYLIQTMIEELREELSHYLLNENNQKKPRLGELLSLIKLLHQAGEEIRTSTVPQLPLEMAVVEWCLEKKEDRGLRIENENEDRRSKIEAKLPNPSTLNPPTSPQSSTLNPQSSNLQSLWPQILTAIKPYNHSVEALLKGCEPIELSDNILTLRFFYQFHKERIEEKRNQDLVEKVVSETLGAPFKIRCVLGQKTSDAGNFDQNQSNSSDLLKMAQEVFGGEIIA